MYFLVCQRLFSKTKLVKTSLRTQLKQINLKNRFHFLTESPKEGFNDIVFQHFVDQLKHCNLDMQMDFQLATTSSSVFVLVFNIFGCSVFF